ncbi:MAG: hypothetical protein AAFP70_06770 [Calditrichota bacterium]
MKQSNGSSILRNILILFFLLQFSLLHAQDSKQDKAETEKNEPYAEMKEEMRENFKAIEERLELSDEQREAFRPVVKESTEQRLAVMKRYGIEPGNPSGIKDLGFRTKLKLRGDMQAIDKSVEKQLKEILSDDQLKLWKEIQEERRAEMQKQMKGS